MRPCHRSGWRPFSVAGAALAITLATAACDFGFGPARRGRPDAATIQVSGESPVPLVLVTSKEWRVELDDETGQQRIVLSKADTVELELPYQRTVALAPTYRILFRLINPDADHDANVRMRVSLDEDVVFDQQATLRNAALQYSHTHYR
jgi:hypothetical protein